MKKYFLDFFKDVKYQILVRKTFIAILNKKVILMKVVVENVIFQK